MGGVVDGIVGGVVGGVLVFVKEYVLVHGSGVVDCLVSSVCGWVNEGIGENVRIDNVR